MICMGLDMKVIGTGGHIQREPGIFYKISLCTLNNISLVYTVIIMFRVG